MTWSSLVGGAVIGGVLVLSGVHSLAALLLVGLVSGVLVGLWSAYWRSRA